MVSWIKESRPPNGISIGSAVFAQLTRLSDTDTQADHATFDVYGMGHICELHAGDDAV